LVPLVLNNLYMLVCNLQQLIEFASYASQPEPTELKSRVNRGKVLWSIFWYFMSVISYGFMQTFNQGLHLRSSKEMFYFSIWETLFMVSMAMSYFYSWQTYSLNDMLTKNGPLDCSKAEVVGVTFREVLRHSRNRLLYNLHVLCLSSACVGLSQMLNPLF
jgi:hypothetical protein